MIRIYILFFIALFFISSFACPKRDITNNANTKTIDDDNATVVENAEFINTEQNDTIIPLRTPFTANINVGGPSATADTLSFETNGSESMNIDGSGNVTITALATAGVIHTNGSGVLSTSLIVDADITASTITNDKLSTISSSNVAGDIVVRDGSGNFSAGTVTLSGNLALSESTSSSVGNITKAGTSFIHDYGINNTFVGENAGNFTMTGTANSIFGVNALNANTTGCHNTAMGFQAMDLNTTGTNNSAFGYLTLTNNTSGFCNTTLGGSALGSNITGSNNTACGYQALQANTTGSSNIAIGQGAGNALTTGSNNIDIGNAGVAAESNIIRIGTSGTQTACYVAGINGTTLVGSAVFVSSSGQLGTLVSSIRYKENVQDMHEKSSPILNLRPVTFTYKTDATHAEQVGLIAEEVQKILPNLVLYDADGQIISVKYHDLAVLLLNELIKQNEIIKQLKEQIAQDNKITNDRLTALEAYACA